MIETIVKRQFAGEPPLAYSAPARVRDAVKRRPHHEERFDKRQFSGVMGV